MGPIRSREIKPSRFVPSSAPQRNSKTALDQRVAPYSNGKLRLDGRTCSPSNRLPSPAVAQGRPIRFVPDSPLEGAGFEPLVPRQESRRFEPASVPSRVGRCRRGGYGPGGDRRPDRAVEIADRRWCASEPPLESRIKPSRRVGPSRGTDGSNPFPSSGESGANSPSRRPFAASKPPLATSANHLNPDHTGIRRFPATNASRRFRTAGTSADRGFRAGRHGGDVAARHQDDSAEPSSRIPVKDS